MLFNIWEKGGVDTKALINTSVFHISFMNMYLILTDKNRLERSIRKATFNSCIMYQMLTGKLNITELLTRP